MQNMDRSKLVSALDDRSFFVYMASEAMFKERTVPQELGPPWKSVHDILTTSASIFLTPGKMSGWSGLLHAKSP